MGCRASRFLCKQKTLSMSHGAPREHDGAGGEGGPGPGAAAKGRPSPRLAPLPWNPREPGVGVGLGALWAGGGAGGQRELSWLHLALIRTLTAFYVSGWRKAGDVNTLLEEGFF